jgi:acyl-CoA synthetase (AMP-forming)/AMP-acid ligase II
LFENFTTKGNRVAIVSERGLEYCYNDLAALSLSRLSKLESKSVCLLICNLSETAIIYYIGLIRKRITTILVDANLGQQKIEKIISCYSPNYIISPLTSSTMPTEFEIIDSLEDFIIYQNKLEKHDSILKDTSLCLTTSGSTGSAKYVKLSLRNIESNTESIIRAVGIDQNQITITTMPMHYSYGLSVINTSLEAGGTLIVNTSQVTSKEFWLRITKYNVNTLSGVPYIYEQLSRLSPEFLNRTKITKFTQAGGKLSKPVREHFKEIVKEARISFYVMYGQTEATARMAVLPPEDFNDFENAIGFAIPGGNLTVCDESGARVETPEVIGEICFEGPNVFQGYATNRIDLIENQPKAPILKTGDLGYFDGEGRFYITGRLKRITKLLGNRIDLEEVESFFLEQGVETICVEHRDRLFIVSTLPKIPPEIQTCFLEYSRISPLLVTFESIPEIPRLSSGKVDYGSVIKSIGEF